MQQVQKKSPWWAVQRAVGDHSGCGGGSKGAMQRHRTLQESRNSTELELSVWPGLSMWMTRCLRMREMTEMAPAQLTEEIVHRLPIAALCLSLGLESRCVSALQLSEGNSRRSCCLFLIEHASVHQFYSIRFNRSPVIHSTNPFQSLGWCLARLQPTDTS